MAAVATLNQTQISQVKTGLIDLVANDPEFAKEFLMRVGYTDADAGVEITDIQSKIMLAARQDELLALTATIKDAFKDIKGLPEIPDDVEKVEVNILYTHDAGWSVAKTKTTIEGQVVKSGSSDGGGSRRGRVPTPVGIKSWQGWFAEAHPEEHEKAEAGASYSAPRKLYGLGDEVFLQACSDAGIDADEAYSNGK